MSIPATQEEQQQQEPPILTLLQEESLAEYTYDGDGKLVMSQVGSEITLYPNVYYEVQGATVRKYYFAGSQRIAVRENNELTFLLADHLGSTVGTVNSSGNLSSRTKYTAFGETRGAATTSTDYLYTGQRAEGEIGLYFYNARWYDPELARFTQADTIIPEAGNPMAWDRYAYVNNNPIRFNDPSGHCPECLVMGGIMGIGALIGYGTQVYNNFQNGLTGFSAFSTNIQLEPIWKGAIIAGGVALVGTAVVTAISSIGPTVGAITGIACADGDCSNEVNTGTNVVYRMIENGKTKYIGITNNYYRRAEEHFRAKGWIIEPIPGLENLNRFDAKAMEQVLIEYYKLSNLYNKINSIASTNIIYNDAIERGKDILNTIGFITQ